MSYAKVCVHPILVLKLVLQPICFKFTSYKHVNWFADIVQLKN